MATLKDVAKKAGTSIATASRILNDKSSPIPISEETKQKVLQAAKKLDYYPNIFARSLRTKKTGIVGVVVMDITDPYFSGVIDGIEKTLNDNHYHFLLSSTQNSLQQEELYLDMLRRSRVDGLLILGGAQQFTAGEIERLVASSIPIVVAGRKSPSPEISSVAVDNFAGGFLATEHLIKLGHQDIMHLTTTEPRADAHERLLGYEDALEKHGLKEKCWIVKGGITARSGYQVMGRVLRKEKKPTAVFVYNDGSALGVIRAIKSQGLKIPQEIAVVGFDDIPTAAYFDPPLTTVRQPQEEMGKIGAELLMRAIKENKKPTEQEQIVLESKLILRESSKPKTTEG